MPFPFLPTAKPRNLKFRIANTLTVRLFSRLTVSFSLSSRYFVLLSKSLSDARLLLARSTMSSAYPAVSATTDQSVSVEFQVGAYESSFSLQIWKVYGDEFSIELISPGVNIPAPRAGGGYASFTGTSFATPFVSGSAALMMEWGILRGNDPFLYGEKLKAYLVAGAKPIASESEYPNRRVGWGALCLSESLPGYSKTGT